MKPRVVKFLNRCRRGLRDSFGFGLNVSRFLRSHDKDLKKERKHKTKHKNQGQTALERDTIFIYAILKNYMMHDA